MITFSEFQNFISSVTPTITEISKKYFMSDISVNTKNDSSPVTIADCETEAFLRDRIEQLYPTHNIIGEENGDKNAVSEYTWILDPIDGTYSFIHGIPLFTTLIAFCVDMKPVYGAIFQPISGELAIGDNNITFYNGKVTSLRNAETLAGTTILTTSTTNIEKFHSGDAFRDLSLRGKCVRTWGDGYGYMMLVSSRADIMIDPNMSIWDSAAVIPVVRGAGGIITDYKGDAPEAANSIIATTNTKLHKIVIDALNK